MIEKLTHYLSELAESFNDLLDFFFPYKQRFQEMSADEFISYYHHKYHWISRRILVYLFPFFIIYILIFVMFVGTFVVPSQLIEPRFRTFFFAFLFMTIGYFYSFGQELKGPLLLLLGNLIAATHGEISLPLDITLILISFMLINICRGKRFSYYKDLAANVLKNKLRIELEDMELDYLLGKYPVDYDIYQQKCAKENGEDDQF